jgi:wobble nucleotide-excising tRNase
VSADDKAAAAWDDYVSQQQEEKIEQLERELNAANDRIKRLEEAGDMMEKLLPEGSICDKAAIRWTKAREAKP